MTDPGTLVLTGDDIRQLLARFGVDVVMDQVIESVQKAMLDHDHLDSGVRARDGFLIGEPPTGCVEWMPYHRVGESITVKVVSYAPGNGSLANVPTILGTVGRWDGQTGRLRALADGVILTALRTGAASAIATRCLAHPEARVLGIVGAGAQAVTQVHALGRCLPIDMVLVSDIDPDAASSLAERVVSFCQATVKVVSSEEIGQVADVICTATSVAPGAGPVLDGLDPDRRVHVNAIGADLPGKWELPLSVLRAATVVPDLRIQALAEGECQRLETAEIGPELFEVLRDPGCVASGPTTVFDSTGTALEDHAALDVLLELAEAEGVGRWLDLEHRPSDIRNPYSISSLTGIEPGVR